MLYVKPRPRSVQPEVEAPRNPLDVVKVSNRNYGRVPSYLQQATTPKAVPKASVPAVRQMSEKERRVALETLNAQRQGILEAMGRIPDRDPATAERRRKEYEQKIARIDKQAKLYGRYHMCLAQ